MLMSATDPWRALKEPGAQSADLGGAISVKVLTQSHERQT